MILTLNRVLDKLSSKLLIARNWLLVVLVVPIRDFVSSIFRIRKYKAERKSRAQEQLQHHINSFTGTRPDSTKDVDFRKLINDGADPNTEGL